jgi:hypothetical protein
MGEWHFLPHAGGRAYFSHFRLFALKMQVLRAKLRGDPGMFDENAWQHVQDKTIADAMSRILEETMMFSSRDSDSDSHF